MPTIYLRDSSTTLATDSSHFTLRSNGRKVCRIAPTVVEQLIVAHGVEVTRAALDRLGAMGIPVTFLDREARVRARLVPPWKFDATPRLGQARALFDETARLTIARRLIDAKVANAATVLCQHASNHPNPELTGAARQLRDLRPQIISAPDIEILRGFEGLAGRIWFSVLGMMLRAPWAEFHGRNRRPPRDPVNAVLSYTYAVLSHQMLALTEAAGLDPYIGYLHANEARRPNLVLDIMEPFRPVLGDRLMLRLINLGTLRPEHFAEERGTGHGIFIAEEGRLAILEAFSSWVNQCDESLGARQPAPSSLLEADVTRFARHAAKHHVHNFVPFYLDPSDAPCLDPAQ